MHAIPDALAPMAAYRQFIVYVVVPKNDGSGKTNKFPIDFRTGRVTAKGSGGAHDPAIWTDASNAIAHAAQLNLQAGGDAYGVGFVFSSSDPFWFLDIDGAYSPESGWSYLATSLVAAFPGAAVEVSHSRRGLHIFGTGHVPPHRTKPKDSSLGLEFYNTGRFVALTGINAVGNAATDFSAVLPALVAQFFAPDAATDGSVEEGSIMARWAAACEEGPVAEWRGPSDDEKLIERAMRSTSARAAFGGNVASFADLWTANVDVLSKAYPPDAGGFSPYDNNRVDSALAQHLCFWAGKDAARIERLMQRSALRRDKWEREDYLPRTILAVRARQGDVLTDKEPEPVAHMPPPLTGERRTAPRPTAVTGATFLSVEQQVELFNGCVYVQDQHKILVPGGAMLKPDQFRVMFGGYTMPMDNANERTTRDAYEAFTQHQAYRAPRADTSCFKPDREPGELINEGGRVLVNTWWPVEVRRMVGDATPFWTHMHKLLPNDRDRLILLYYMAACVQHRGYKFQWAPLLQGVEGNGKTLLTRCVAEAVGRRYVHWPKASKIAAQFNAWMVGKLFYAVEDIYVADQRRDVIEELKPMITGGDGLEIEGKGVDQISVDICGNFMFNSNHKDAILKTRNDRRFCVLFTAQQQAADLARDGMRGSYMHDIHNWLRADGFAIVAELLHTLPIPDELNPAKGCQYAPDTSSTEEAIAASRGGVEQEVLEAVAQGLPGFCGDWVSSMALDRLLEQQGRGRFVARNKRGDLLASLGYIPHPGLAEGRVNNVVLPDGGKPRLYVKAGSASAALVEPAAIGHAYQSAQNVTLGATA